MKRQISIRIARADGGHEHERMRITLCLLIFVAIATIGLASRAAAQIVVVGTGNPDIDVPAVQAAVDQGGDVILRGHFSFDRRPTIILPPIFAGNQQAMILVSKAVAISGARDERDDDREMTTIEGGTIPFYVEAPGYAVTIRGLRFVRPKARAVVVYAVSGLVIASCKIEDVEVTDIGSVGIEIDTSGGPMRPGHPENVSGRLLIVNNDIDMVGGTADVNTLGIIIWYVGIPGAEVEAYLSGNTIRNFTERAMNIRGVGGRTYIEGNVIATGTLAGTNVTALHPIFVQDPSPGNSYLIAHNSVDVQWHTGSAAGITVRDAIAHAFVVDNDVNMEAPEGTDFDFRSAGIESAFGTGQGIVIMGNRIRGRARAALAVRGGVPVGTAFVLNHLDGFKASLADVFVDEGVRDTLIVGQGTVEDHGVGTVIVLLPFDHHEEGGDEDRKK